MRFQLSTYVIVAAVCSVMHSQPSAAESIGNWSRTCMAPNWKYGALESVWDQNVYSPIEAWAFAERMPAGHWQISYNLAQISPRLATPDFFKFLFYRECAFVKYRSPDQHLGDCQALSEMKTNHDLSPQTLEEISAAYASRGFSFPTGGACPSVP